MKMTKDNITTTLAKSTITAAADVHNIYEIIKQNLVIALDEIAKVQPQFSQLISNLQLDYIQVTKNVIQNVTLAQEQFAASLNIPSTVALLPPYSEQFAKQTNEITNNTRRTVGINNQLTINTLHAARENLKIYNRTIDAVTEFNSNVAKAWTTNLL